MKKITSIFCIILLSNCGFTVLKKQVKNENFIKKWKKNELLVMDFLTNRDQRISSGEQI